MSWDPSRPAVLLVSHEASSTGAPILSLNLGEQFARTHTVIHLVLAPPGPLSQELRQHAHWLIHSPSPELTAGCWKRARRKLPRNLKLGFAIVNSLVGFRALETLRRQGVAGLCLVHEFATYMRPPLAPSQAYLEAGLWADQLVFSTRLTRDDALKHWPALQTATIRVLPQGQSRPPGFEPIRAEDPGDEEVPEGLEGLVEDLRKGAQLVLAAGAVQPRKGVDLFVAMAQALEEEAPDPDRRYVWLGGGYAPEHDLMVSVWLEDQIARSGLDQQLKIIEAPRAYGWLMRRCQVFVLSSRLDPLPNVAIDAALAAKPILAFEQASGIAEWLDQDPLLRDHCLAPYWKPSTMAEKTRELLQNPDLAAAVGHRCCEQAKTSFDLERYTKTLCSLGEEAQSNLQAERIALKELLKRPKAIDRDFHGLPQRWSQRHLAHHYVRQWRTGINPRKPHAGFHPGIYQELTLGSGAWREPLLDWHRKGKPEGPWTKELITPYTGDSRNHEGLRVGVHIHVHYQELLPEVLKSISYNSFQPALIISLHDASAKDAVADLSKDFGCALLDLRVVPNRGRNLGPLFSGIGHDLEREFEIYAHLHTKGSRHQHPRSVERWRNFLLDQLMGTAATPMGDRVLEAMMARPKIGLVFPDDPSAIGWDANRGEAEALAKTFGLGELPEQIDVPVGAMFWARRGALTPIYERGWSWDDYPAEPIATDGTVLHAMERLLPLINRKAGFQTAHCHVPGCSR